MSSGEWIITKVYDNVNGVVDIEEFEKPDFDKIRAAKEKLIPMLFERPEIKRDFFDKITYDLLIEKFRFKNESAVRESFRACMFDFKVKLNTPDLIIIARINAVEAIKFMAHFDIYGNYKGGNMYINDLSLDDIASKGHPVRRLFFKEKEDE